MDSEFDESFTLLTAASMVGVDIASFDIPLDKVTRYVWVALDAYNRAAATVWTIEGELRFTKHGSPVLTIPLMRGVNPFLTTGGTATTQSSGGPQPGIVLGHPGAVGFQTYVDIPCMTLEVTADRVALFLKNITDVAGTSVFVAGLRILSQ